MRHLAFLWALLAASALRADGSAVTAASSFKLLRGARPAAMAGAYTALADDPLSMQYNPAGLTELREVAISLSHMQWIGDVQDDAVSLGIPLFGLGAWGLGASYLHTTDETRDNWGNADGTSFNDFDFSLQAAFALQLGDDASAGLTYKIIRQGYGGSDQFASDGRFNMGSAFDFGAQYRLLDRKVILALTSQNMGTNLSLGTSYAPLPWTLKAALGWHASSELALDLEYEHQPYDFFNKLRLGGEYTFNLGDERAAIFRAGYLLGPENVAGGLSGFSAGLGGQWHAWKVDYAFVPKGDLGVSHLFSISFGFGQH